MDFGDDLLLIIALVAGVFVFMIWQGANAATSVANTALSNPQIAAMLPALMM